MRVLIVGGNGPDSNYGGGQRNLLIIKIFEAKGYKVDVVLIINEIWGVYPEDGPLMTNWKKEFGLIHYFCVSFKRPFLPSIKVLQWIKKRQNDYDIILFRYEKIAFKSGFQFLKREKIIIDFDDFILPQIKGIRKLKYQLLYKIEKHRIRKAWVVYKQHIRYFKNSHEWVPNLPLEMFYPQHNSFLKSRSDVPSIIFVGSYLNGLFDLFRSNAGAKLKSQIFLEIFVVSKAVNEHDKEEFKEFPIKWLNNIKDISEVYEKAWVAIVPGYKPAGPVIKLIEAIYYETPVVSSEDYFFGYEIFNHKEELIPSANNKDIFVENIFRLLKDESKLDDRGLKLKGILEAEYSFNKLIENLSI